MNKPQLADALESRLENYRKSEQKTGDVGTDMALRGLDPLILEGLAALDLDPYDKDPQKESVVKWGFKEQGPKFIGAVERLISELRA